MDITVNTTFPAMQANAAETSLYDALKIVDRRIAQSLAGAQGGVRDMCAHIACSGGKRLRPRLVLQSGLAFSGLNARVVDAAVAAELIHMASLVHDDIIDGSPLRRGKPSVNKLWGNHAAVLCGDWLFAQAFGVLSGAGMGESLRFMVEAIQAMCNGEVLQAMHSHDLDIDVDTYYSVIAGKTGRLLESCCMAGAAAGGADASGVAALGSFGLNLGMAFQIADDILDFEGSSGKTGKPVGEDLRQGIVTLPVILLLQDGKLGGEARQALSGGNNSAGALETIRGLMSAGGSIGKAYAAARSFLGKALGGLDALPESVGKAALRDLAASLMAREN